MVEYDNILNIISIVLLLIILFIIIFGCRERKYNERFTNNKEEEEKKEEKKPILSAFENNILKQLSDGSLTTEQFTDLIKKEKFTQQNLNNVIDYVEYNKGLV